FVEVVPDRLPERSRPVPVQHQHPLVSVAERLVEETLHLADRVVRPKAPDVHPQPGTVERPGGTTPAPPPPCPPPPPVAPPPRPRDSPPAGALSSAGPATPRPPSSRTPAPAPPRPGGGGRTPPPASSASGAGASAVRALCCRRASTFARAASVCAARTARLAS